MNEIRLNGRSAAMLDQSTQQWVTSGRLSSPYDGNNNRAKLLRRRISFGTPRMVNSARRGSDTCEDDEDDNSTKNGSKLESSTWDDANNSDSDIKSKFDEAFSEGSSSSGEKDSENVTEVELRLRVRRSDEENACLREELLRAEEVTNSYQRQLSSLQQKFEQMRERCDQLLRENDEQREMLSSVEKQEQRCQVALQKIDRERSALIEKLQARQEAFNCSVERLKREKSDCARQLAICKSKLREKEAECDGLQVKLGGMNEMVASLEKNYEETIRCLQDKNDDLRNELNARLMSLDCPTSLDQEVCVTPVGYLDSSSDSVSCQNEKVQLQDSLYAELKASGFSFEDIKKIRDLERDLEWYNNEIYETGRQIDKIIAVLRKSRKTASPRRSAAPDPSDETSPILMIYDKITILSKEVSEALRKPSACNSSSQVSADCQADRLREFGILTFDDYLHSPIKAPPSKPINTENVFLTYQPCEIKDKPQVSHLTHSTNLVSNFNYNNVTKIEKLGSSIGLGSMSSTASRSNGDISSSRIKIQTVPKINLTDTDTNPVNGETVDEEIITSELPVSTSSPIANRDRGISPKLSETDTSMTSKSPKRKISVFQRSFDIDTVYEVQDNGGIAESHTLSERINGETDCPPNDLINRIVTSYGGTGVYRTADVSQSSDSSSSPSSIKLHTWHEEDTAETQTKPGEFRSVVLAPAKLNFSVKSDSMNDKSLSIDTVSTVSDTESCTKDEAPATGVVTTEEKSVGHSMSSREDSSDDSESDSPGSDEKFDDDEKRKINQTTQSRSSYLVHHLSNFEVRNVYKSGDRSDERPRIRRSLSEGENMDFGSDGCPSCNTGDERKQNGVKKEIEVIAFPSLSDARLQESKIAHLSDSEDLEGKDLGEEELERKYLAFSLGLCTDRVTLTRRRALSLRHRDHTEHDLATELAKMHQSIQEFAPLCFDIETAERIELARNQIDIIAQCAHRVSCTAETLGAIQQEYRISRAMHLADRYLKVLRDRCEKVMADLAEKKRILSENNIVIDETNGEAEEVAPGMRYRALSPTANRTMMARRRASIATIFRPIGIGQEAAKDTIRQRNSVSGRVTITRRPSLSSESQRWEAEKLNRTDSSSVGELRDVLEHAESRRTSREENNNLVRNQITVCENETVERRMSNSREEPIIETLPEEQEHELHEEETSFARARLSLTVASNSAVSWRLMLWCVIISFLVGFYIKDAVSSNSSCTGTPLRWWSIEEILGRHVQVRNTAPRPI